MGNPVEHTPVDQDGLVIEDRPAYYSGNGNGKLPPTGFTGASAAHPMPPRLALALVKAARECGAAAKTGEGVDDRDGRDKAFSFMTIDDVLEAAGEALSNNNLFVYPMCIHYDIVAREVNYVRSFWADYSFQFMIVWADKDQAEQWVCPHDIRHISLPYEGGKTEGMAQSYALKHFYRGILRIKTGEPDAESVRVPRGNPPPQEAQKPAPKQPAPEVMTASSETAPIAASADAKPRRGRPPAARFPFDFGRSADPGGNGFEEVTAEECLALFERIVKPLTPGKRKEWKEINRIGLEQLCGAAKPTWLQIMRVLEATS